MTLLRTDVPAAATAPAEPEHRHHRGPAAGPVTAALGLLLVLAGVAATLPTLLLVGLVASAAALLHRRLPLDVAVPAAATGLLLLAVTAGLGASALGVDLLARPGLLVTGYVLAATGVLALTVARRSRAAPGWAHGSGAVALLPAAVALGTGALQAVSVGVAKSWAFWGTDLVRHMDMVRDLQLQGALDYSAIAYPRGLHALAALVSVPGRPTSAGDALLAYDLRLTASLTWLTTALLVATSSALAVRLAQRLGASPAVGLVAGVLVGTGLLLTNTFVLSFVYLGAAPSLMAATVLLLLPLAAAAGLLRSDRLSTVVAMSGLCLVALAHLWQALLPAPAVAGLVVAVTQLPHLLGSARRAAAWRRGAVAAAVLVAAVVLVLPPLHRVAEAGGTAAASTPGELAGQPWRVLVPAVLCLVVLLPHLRQAWAGLLAGTALGLVVSAAVLLRGSGDPTDLEQYYPAKVFWFLTVLLAPLLAVVVTRLAAAALVAASRLAGRLGPGAFVVRAAGVAVLVAIAASLWLPYLLGVESATAATWHRAAPDQRDVATPFPDWSAFRYEVATRFGPDDRPEVVVPYTVAVGSSDPYGTRIVSELLGFLTRQPEVLEGRATVCAQIAAVAGDRPAVVLTQLPAPAVRAAMADAGCAGRAGIVTVRPGPG